MPSHVSRNFRSRPRRRSGSRPRSRRSGSPRLRRRSRRNNRVFRAEATGATGTTGTRFMNKFPNQAKYVKQFVNKEINFTVKYNNIAQTAQTAYFVFKDGVYSVTFDKEEPPIFTGGHGAAITFLETYLSEAENVLVISTTPFSELVLRNYYVKVVSGDADHVTITMHPSFTPQPPPPQSVFEAVQQAVERFETGDSDIGYSDTFTARRVTRPPITKAKDDIEENDFNDWL